MQQDVEPYDVNTQIDVGASKADMVKTDELSNLGSQSGTDVDNHYSAVASAVALTLFAVP